MWKLDMLVALLEKERISMHEEGSAHLHFEDCCELFELCGICLVTFNSRHLVVVNFDVVNIRLEVSPHAVA